MSTSISLRRSLRKIPAFRSWPGQELEKIIELIICKEYKPGDVLWRTSTRTDYLGIIRSGEVVLEHQIYGSIIRTTRLFAGDIVLPNNLKTANTHSVILTRAATEVKIYVLQMEQIDITQSRWSDVDVNLHPKDKHKQYSYWNRFWIALVAILIIFINWSDLTRIISGVLYLASSPTSQFGYDNQKYMMLLQYAETVDKGAVFAHNQEGYIWFHRNDLQNAEAAFVKAINIDLANGPPLNNLGVTYFVNKQTPQSIEYLQKAAQNDADSAIVRYNFGVALMKQNYYKEAISELKEASFIDSTWILPYIQLGFIYIETGDYVRAEQVARTAITLDVTQQSPHLILAIALYNLDKNQEALKSIENALKIEPNDRVSMFYKARILNNLGEFDTALSILDQLLKSTTDPAQIFRITEEIEALQRSQ